MNVRQMINVLQTYKPDEEICVLWWDRHMYEGEVSAEVWSLLVSEFESELESETPRFGLDISGYLAARVEEEVRRSAARAVKEKSSQPRHLTVVE